MKKPATIAFQLGFWWIFVGKKKLHHKFVTLEAATAFCRKKFKTYTIITPQGKGHNQELPNKSVWTGAPWDHNFKPK